MKKMERGRRGGRRGRGQKPEIQNKVARQGSKYPLLRAILFWGSLSLLHPWNLCKYLRQVTLYLSLLSYSLFSCASSLPSSPLSSLHPLLTLSITLIVFRASFILASSLIFYAISGYLDLDKEISLLSPNAFDLLHLAVTSHFYHVIIYV